MIFWVAMVRIVAGAVDVAWLATRPALLHWWWATKRRKTYQPTSTSLVTRHGLDESDVVYGEVFVAPTWALLKACGVAVGSVVVDIGCGAGAVLIAARRLGAVARGIDIDDARVLVAHAAAAGATVVVGDGRDPQVIAALAHDADVVWSSWLTWSPTAKQALTAQLATCLRPGALWITLGDDVAHAGEGAFVVVARTKMWCSWGRADVVVSRKC